MRAIEKAEELSARQREISVAEFFEKNRHLLGFDNPTKALLTVVKEAVDNSLDACEEAEILPEIKVSVKQAFEGFRILDRQNVELGKLIKRGSTAELWIGDSKVDLIEQKDGVFIFDKYKFICKGKVYRFYRGRKELKIAKLPSDRFIISVEDNGPGIVKAQIPKIFGKLLYGSRFGSGIQSRGAQGIGISAALLYAQLTTGKPAEIWSRTSPKRPVHYFQLRIDTTKNEPIIVQEKNIQDGIKEHGLKVQFEIEGHWTEKRHSVYEYLKQTAAVNPYANIIYESPYGERIEFKRTVERLPPKPKPIKPHPHGVEMGMLERMLKLSDCRTIESFLANEFCRVGPQSAVEIRKLAGLKSGIKPSKLDHRQIELLWRTLQSYPFMKPPTNCLSPIGEENFIQGIKKEYEPEFVVGVTRPPSVYRGNPFQIEVVIGYGGKLSSFRLLRFANRVPLLYQASSCAITKAVQKIDWRHYGLEQEGAFPKGPIIIVVHMASVWIPYVSEAKEAIDPYPAIVKEIKLALQEAGRKLSRLLAGKRRREQAAQRRGVFEKYIPELAESLERLSNVKKEKIIEGLKAMLKGGINENTES